MNREINPEMIMDKLSNHEERISRSEDKITSLEKNGAVMDERVNNLCDKLDKQTKATNGLNVSIMLALITFVLSIVLKFVH